MNEEYMVRFANSDWIAIPPMRYVGACEVARVMSIPTEDRSAKMVIVVPTDEKKEEIAAMFYNGIQYVNKD